MTSVEIKILLLKRGIRQDELAESIGVHPSAISQAINRLRRQAPTKEKIAKYLNIPMNELWPEEEK
ncbi:MAG: helix-turn-helix transcriptional regulator [bacterium]